MEDKLKILATLLSEHQLTKINYEEGDLKITLEKALNPVISQPLMNASTMAVPILQGAGTSQAATAEEIIDDSEAVKSPLAGIYYGKPSPEARNFVREGQHVKAGETLCIIESMKIMNEIKAPYDLTILRIQKRDEEIAEYNEELFRVKR